MLKKLDVYIIKKYLVTFFFTMVMISMIAIVIDFFEKVDKFLNENLKLSDVFLKYYLNFIPWINGLLWPMFALLAVIFFTSRMARDSEVIAMLSAGISYRRFLRPFLIAATILAGLLWIGSNYVIPNSSRKKNEFEAEYIRRSSKKTLANDIHFFIGPSEKVYFRSYSTKDSLAKGFRLERFDSLGKLSYMIKADELKYRPKTGQWGMKGYEIRNIGPLKETFKRIEIIEKDTTFAFKPDDFVRYTKQMEMMTTTDLRTYISEEKRKGISTPKAYFIELYRRTADPFTIIILTIIGVSVASRKVRGGMGFHLAAGVVLGATFVIVSKFAVTFATNLNLHPAIAIWIPNILFSLVAYQMYRGAQT